MGGQQLRDYGVMEPVEWAGGIPEIQTMIHAELFDAEGTLRPQYCSVVDELKRCSTMANDYNLIAYILCQIAMGISFVRRSSKGEST
jgi:hypothetical protein